MWSQKWQRIPSNVSYKRAREGLCVAFEFTLAPEFKQNDHVLFAYAQPFTRTDIERSLVDFEAKCASQPQVYFHKDILVESLEGHPMHLVTVTGQNEQSDDCDEVQDPCNVLYKRGGSRPRRFRKQTVFISSRVHCGETCASFFLQGMLDFLAG